MSAVRLQQDLRAALRTRHKRLKDTSADHIHDEIRLATDWISRQPALHAMTRRPCRGQGRIRRARQSLAPPGGCQLPLACQARRFRMVDSSAGPVRRLASGAGSVNVPGCTAMVCSVVSACEVVLQPCVPELVGAAALAQDLQVA